MYLSKAAGTEKDKIELYDKKSLKAKSMPTVTIRTKNVRVRPGRKDNLNSVFTQAD